MSLKQKLADFKVLIKKDRKTQMVLVGIVGFFVVWAMMPEPRRRHTGPIVAQRGGGGSEAPSRAGSHEEAYKDLITAFKGVQDEQKKMLDEQSEQIGRLTGQMTLYEERTAEIFKRMLERIADIEATGGHQVVGGSAYANNANDGSYTPKELLAEDEYGDLAGAGGGAAQADGLESFGDAGLQEQPAPVLPPAVNKVAFIAPGDSVRVELLSGVNAPTDGTPYPVVLRVVSDVTGPDGSSLPLGEARIIAAAQGSLVDSRALFRLTTMNLRMPNGEKKVIDIDGWIVGEDGIRGMKGILDDPLGKGIAAAGFTGVVDAIGQTLSGGNVTTTTGNDGAVTSVITGDTGEYLVGQGVSKAADEWSSLIRERLKRVPPLVKVYSGRQATAVFTRSTSIPGLFEALETEGEMTFVSLD